MEPLSLSRPHSSRALSPALSHSALSRPITLSAPQSCPQYALLSGPHNRQGAFDDQDFVKSLTKPLMIELEAGRLNDTERMPNGTAHHTYPNPFPVRMRGLRFPVHMRGLRFPVHMRGLRFPVRMRGLRFPVHMRGLQRPISSLDRVQTHPDASDAQRFRRRRSSPRFRRSSRSSPSPPTRSRRRSAGSRSSASRRPRCTNPASVPSKSSTRCVRPTDQPPRQRRNADPARCVTHAPHPLTPIPQEITENFSRLETPFTSVGQQAVRIGACVRVPRTHSGLGVCAETNRRTDRVCRRATGRPGPPTAAGARGDAAPALLYRVPNGQAVCHLYGRAPHP